MVPSASTTTTATGSASKAFQITSCAEAEAAPAASTPCHGVHAASRSAPASSSGDAVSMTQALASDDTEAGSAVCCGTRMAMEAPSGDVRSTESVRSSASGPIAKSKSRTSCWRASSPSASVFEYTSVVSAISWRNVARSPWIRAVRSLVVETNSTLSAATAGSAGASDQPKLPPSKPLSKPLPVRSTTGSGAAGIVSTTGAGAAGAAATGAGTGAGAGGSGIGAAGASAAGARRFAASLSPALRDFFSIVLPDGAGGGAGAGGSAATGSGSGADSASGTGGGATGALARSRASTAVASASGWSRASAVWKASLPDAMPCTSDRTTVPAAIVVSPPRTMRTVPRAPTSSRVSDWNRRPRSEKLMRVTSDPPSRRTLALPSSSAANRGDCRRSLSEASERCGSPMSTSACGRCG